MVRTPAPEAVLLLELVCHRRVADEQLGSARHILRGGEGEAVPRLVEEILDVHVAGALASVVEAGCDRTDVEGVELLGAEAGMKM